MIKGVKTYQKGQIKLWNSWKQPQCHAARSLHQKMSHGNCVQHPFCALNPGLAMSASHIYIQKLLQQGGPNSVGSNLGEVVSLDILICPKKWNAPNFFARIRRNSEDHEETPSTRMCTMPQQERSDTNKMQKRLRRQQRVVTMPPVLRAARNMNVLNVNLRPGASHWS